MKKAIILHNPGAGDENPVKTELVRMIKEKGYTSLYHVVKKNNRWTKRLEQVDFAVLAGGDGTIRRVAKELMKRTLMDRQVLLALLPMGTANNIAKTLNIDRDMNYEDHIKSWRKRDRQHYDIGIVHVKKQTHIFLESAGLGLFPLLIQRMDEIDVSHLETAEEELRFALKVFHELILSAPAHKYKISINDQIFSGKSILTEVLNTPFMGPNLHMAPEAKIDDGLLDIVYIDEQERQVFADYIQGLINGQESAFLWKTLRAEKLSIKSNSGLMHIDDELIQTSKSVLNFEIRNEVLSFIR